MTRQLLLVIIAAAAYGNDCGTIASSTPANWSSPTTWVNCGGVYPQAGDTFAIKRPVIADIDIAVGTSPADTSSTIAAPVGEITANDSGAAGALTIGAGVSFTMRGSIRLASSGRARAAVYFLAGSTWTFDSSLSPDPANTVYRFYPSADGSQSDLVIRGSSTSHATVRGKPASCGTCANAILLQSYTGGDSGRGAGINIDAQYADLYDVGSATRGAVEFALAYPGQYLRMSHCTLSRTGGLRHVAASAPASPSDGSQDFVLDDVKTTASLQTSLTVTSAPHLTMGAGRFRIANSYFDAGFAGGLSGATLDHDVFDRTFEPTDDVAYAPASTSRVVIHQARARSSFAAWHGNATDLYTYMDSFATVASPKFWKVDPGSTQTGWIFEYGQSTGSGAVCLEANGALAPSSITVQNAIVLPNAQGKAGAASCRAVHTGTTLDTWSIYHSTLLFGPASAIYYDSGAANRVLNVKSNVFLDPSTSIRANPLSATNSSATLNHFVATGIANNAVAGNAAVSRWTNSYGSCSAANCTANGTPYDIPINVTVPGALDIRADPVPYYAYKNMYPIPGFREWANARYSIQYDGGPTHPTSYTAANEFSAMGADPNLAAAIDDLFSYIRLYWAPMNPALKGAGHDGQDIGHGALAEFRYRAYQTAPLVYGNRFDNSDAWGLYFDSAPRLAGTARGFDAVFLRILPGASAVIPGVASNCYVFHDGDAANATLLSGAASVDGCIFDIAGVATNSSMIDARSIVSLSATHNIVLPTMSGQYAGPLAANASGTFAHNSCWFRCLEPGDAGLQTSAIEWPPAVRDGAADPLWYDFKRNVALFDSKYLGNAAPPWSPDQTYAAGAFASHARPGLFWGERINFRYTNGPSCGGVNLEPLVASNWRSCWEYASLYRIRNSLPDPSATPPRTTMDVFDDQKIGAHGDDVITVLVKWVRAGYAPTNPALSGAASDGYDAGAMPVFYSDQLIRSPRSLSPDRSAEFGGGLAAGGKVKVQQ